MPFRFASAHLAALTCHTAVQQPLFLPGPWRLRQPTYTRPLHSWAAPRDRLRLLHRAWAGTTLPASRLTPGRLVGHGGQQVLRPPPPPRLQLLCRLGGTGHCLAGRRLSTWTRLQARPCPGLRRGVWGWRAAAGFAARTCLQSFLGGSTPGHASIGLLACGRGSGLGAHLPPRRLLSHRLFRLKPRQRLGLTSGYTAQRFPQPAPCRLLRCLRIPPCPAPHGRILGRSNRPLAPQSPYRPDVRSLQLRPCRRTRSADCLLLASRPLLRIGLPTRLPRRPFRRRQNHGCPLTRAARRPGPPLIRRRRHPLPRPTLRRRARHLILAPLRFRPLSAAPAWRIPRGQRRRLLGRNLLPRLRRGHHLPAAWETWIRSLRVTRAHSLRTLRLSCLSRRVYRWYWEHHRPLPPRPSPFRP